MNAYLIEGSSGYALVDSGLHTADAESVLRAALAEAGITVEDVRRVFVTHLHPDHIGMAGTLERAGAEVVMHAPEIANARRMWSRDHSMIDETYAWFERHGMPADVDRGMRDAWLAMGQRVDEIAKIDEAADGETLDLGGRRERVVWTPGHTDYHAVLVDERLLQREAASVRKAGAHGREQRREACVGGVAGRRAGERRARDLLRGAREEVRRVRGGRRGERERGSAGPQPRPEPHRAGAYPPRRGREPAQISADT